MSYQCPQYLMGNCCCCIASQKQQKKIEDLQLQLKQLKQELRDFHNRSSQYLDPKAKQRGQGLEQQVQNMQVQNMPVKDSLQYQNNRLNIELQNIPEKCSHKNLQAKLIRIQQEKQKLITQKDDKNRLIDYLELLVGQKEKEFTQLSHQLKQKQEQIQRHSIAVGKLKQYVIELNNKLQKYKSNNLSYIFCSTLGADILVSYSQSLQQLKENIEFHTKKEIKRFKLLYRFEHFNPVNFHEYFDGHNNIVMILKTQSGHFFGGWSEAPFTQKQIPRRKGLIFSLTNNKFYNLVPNGIAITYDYDHIIFGNSQIRVKWQQLKVFSQFGSLMNPCYNSKGDGVTMLLGEGYQDVILQDYEIYQVLYDIQYDDVIQIGI